MRAFVHVAAAGGDVRLLLDLLDVVLADQGDRVVALDPIDGQRDVLPEPFVGRRINALGLVVVHRLRLRAL